MLILTQHDSISRYAALKVEIAKLYGSESDRHSIQNILLREAPKYDDSQFTVQLLDSFIHEGPNGKHLCSVLELMGPSVSSVLDAPVKIYDIRNLPRARFSMHQTKAILRDVLRGLRFLHANGVVHGDLQARNMLFSLRDLRAFSREQLQQDECNSGVVPLHRLDGKADKWAPRYLAVAKPLSEYSLPKEEQVVKITDMGCGAYFMTRLSTVEQL